jgi:hypothetical protein
MEETLSCWFTIAMQAEGVAFLNNGEKPLAITRNTSHIGTGPHAF